MHTSTQTQPQFTGSQLLRACCSPMMVGRSPFRVIGWRFPDQGCEVIPGRPHICHRDVTSARILKEKNTEATPIPTGVKDSHSSARARFGSGSATGPGWSATNLRILSPHSRWAFPQNTSSTLAPQIDNPTVRHLRRRWKSEYSLCAGEAALVAGLLQRTERLEPDEGWGDNVVLGVAGKEVYIVGCQPFVAIA